jgi:hypothetical protein
MEPTFPPSYWNDTGDIDLGPLPDRLKRPEQPGDEQASKEVASNQVVQRKTGTEAKPKSQQGKTRVTQEETPLQPEAPSAKETRALTLGQELQAKYPVGVTLRTDLEFEEFAYYVDYVRQVRELRNRAAGNRPGKRHAKVANTPPALR